MFSYHGTSDARVQLNPSLSTALRSGDPAVKQILVWMDRNSNPPFIIGELDDTHVVIKAEAVESKLRELNEQVRQVHCYPVLLQAAKRYCLVLLA